MKHALSLIVCFCYLSSLQAQEIPFLSEEEYQWLVNEISGDAAYEHIRYFTQFHRPRGGTPGLLKVAGYVEAKANEYGLEEVRLIRQPYSAPPWNSLSGELWLVEPELKRLASIEQVQLHLADNSRTTHIDRAELVWVGPGASESDYEGRDVTGKIVVTHGSIGQVMREAVWERGALGIIHYPDPAVPDYPVNALSHPDQIHWQSIPVESRDGQPGTFAFVLSARQGVELVQLLRSGKTAAVRVDVESEFGSEGWQVMVEAFIKGREIDHQDIVLTGHLQEEKFSANDDASGCASVLEIGRALMKLIREGRIQRPRRSIRFWWVTEISSERRYFADHPEAPRSMLVNINQDMVGANQGQDVLRVQNMTQLPSSRFHFLNDVAGRLLEFVREANQGNLAVLQAGHAGLYPRPILSRLGTRHRYNAEIIPFHNSTDHMTFNEAPIGVPGITFTNWPDNYIHTSDDDLWNIDRTQLQRNAFTVAAIAYLIARLDSSLFPAVAAETSARGFSRLSGDYRLALGWLAASRDQFHTGRHQLTEAYWREARALSSLKAVAGSSLEVALIDTLLKQLENGHQLFQTHLADGYRSLYSEAPSDEVLSETESQLLSTVPRLAAGPAEFLERRNEVAGVTGLHNLMAFEILNFVNGEHTGLDIYHAVSAEARRAGRHYYGIVTPEMVQSYLENLRSAGLVGF